MSRGSAVARAVVRVVCCLGYEGGEGERQMGAAGWEHWHGSQVGNLASCRATDSVTCLAMPTTAAVLRRSAAAWSAAAVLYISLLAVSVPRTALKDCLLGVRRALCARRRRHVINC